ncbi:SIGNAL-TRANSDUCTION SENSOR PROTEIN-PAS/PAC domain [hydrothermal vent metagenome]|uniref:SIGNAL-TRANSDUCTION SENSOR PROTEIN-PAS/PAC domain n=1 Tax=hydrothermal vent metagenome TaxID=652676 RepID=A0A1W1EA90_9ZZZZ
MAEGRFIYTNVLTRETFKKPKPTSILKHYDGKPMITETDLEGGITYASRRFQDFTGYSKQELVGLPHSIVRHPDMPEGLFYAMWKIIQEKKVWRGYIKSLCRDGSYFWALVYIQPKLDSEGKHIGYVANRKDAYPKSIEQAEKKYAELFGLDHKYDSYFMGMELYHGDDLASFANRVSE